MIFEFSVDPFVFLIIMLCVISQGIFGVGVLLWGTPAFLFWGYSYVETLSLLLPISLAISFTQVITQIRFLHFKHFLQFFFMCLPPMLLGLSIVLIAKIDPTLFVALGLMLNGILRIKRVNILNNGNTDKGYIFLPLIGLIHGLSNLGGAILVIWASSVASNKLQIRTLIAFFYTFLAFSQLIIFQLNFGEIYIPIGYMLVALIINFIVTHYAFTKLRDNNYQMFITVLIFLISSLLMLKYFDLLN